MVRGLSATQAGTTCDYLLLRRVNGLSQGSRLHNLGLRLRSKCRCRLGYWLRGLELLYLWLLELLRLKLLLWLLELLGLRLESRGSWLLELLLLHRSSGRLLGTSGAAIGVTAKKVVERAGDTGEKAALLGKGRGESENTQAYQ